jgi:hypothetical protein
MARFFVTAKRVETHTLTCFVDAKDMFDAEAKALAAINHNRVSLDVTLERHDHGDADWYVENIRKPTDGYEPK